MWHRHLPPACRLPGSACCTNLAAASLAAAPQRDVPAVCLPQEGADLQGAPQGALLGAWVHLQVLPPLAAEAQPLEAWTAVRQHRRAAAAGLGSHLGA